MEQIIYAVTDAIIRHQSYFNIAIYLSTILLGFIDIFPLAYSSSDDSKETKLKLLRRTAVGILLLLAAEITLLRYLGYQPFSNIQTFIVVLLYVYGKALSFIWLRHLKPLYTNWLARYRISQTSDELSDIRVEFAKLNGKAFDPRKYYKLGNMFYGLDKNDEPVYDTIENWQANHQAAIGPTQWGKGIMIGLQIEQGIKAGSGMVLIDQKPDLHMRAIAKNASKKYGRDYVEIDLTGEWKTTKYAFLKSGNRREVRERLFRYIGLASSGTDSEFYLLKERRLVNSILENPSMDYNKLKHISAAVDRRHEKRDEPLPRTSDSLYELQLLKNISDHGVSMRELIKRDAIIYVRGSITDKMIQKATIALLEDVLQSAIATSKKGTNERKSHLFVVIDELRFVVNNYIADSLASIKDTDTHMLVTYQSILDIRNVLDQQVDKDALEKSIDVNTTSKLVYQCKDFETAEWASKLTGLVQRKIVDRQQLEINKYGGEEHTGEAMLTTVEEQLIPTNIFQTLPKKVGVLIRPSIQASLVYPHWVEVDIEYDKPIPLEETASKQQTKIDHNQKYAGANRAASSAAFSKDNKTTSSSKKMSGGEPRTGERKEQWGGKELTPEEDRAFDRMDS